MKSKFTLFAISLLLPFLISGQAEMINLGASFVENNPEKFELVDSDVSELSVRDFYKTKHNGLTHIYFEQMYKGIPVSDAIININILKDQSILNYNSTFVDELHQKVESVSHILDPHEAILSTAEEVGFKNLEVPHLLKSSGDDSYVYTSTNYSLREMTVDKVYVRAEDDRVRLAWDVYMDDIRNHDTWSCKVDAENGEVLQLINRTLKCSHKHGEFHNHNETCLGHHAAQVIEAGSTSGAAKKAGAQMMMGNTYRVYPYPAESPLTGSHDLVTDPHNLTASPYGWHDLDGQAGNETSITRGNNVHAFEDTDGNEFSAGNEPSGSGLGGDINTLTFDFEHNTEAEPEASIDADVVNLFYAVNMVHDISYLLGFDEASGNFQLNNYGNGGTAGDALEAHALDDRNSDGTLDALNNAYFSTSTDGGFSTINMFKWQVSQSGLFSVSAPIQLEGIYSTAGTGNNGWGFDESYNSIDVTGEIAFGLDADPQQPQQGCGELVNANEVSGRIAMIYRGTCQFGTKALNAQNAGAIAAIICNIPGADNQDSDGNTPVGMLPGTDGIAVNIPVLMMGFSDCNAIRASINADIPVTGTIKVQESTGPDQLSGGFDNGVITHEYAHGISSRLIGGPGSLCMFQSDEQMGEGWSDIFTLMYSAKPGDDGSEARGIGNYVDGGNAEGRGIRRFPYSTDMSVNPQTYDDIKGTTAPHPLGEVWTGCLWDMFWEFVDLYGFDADWTNTESGNFKAAQLIIDGMKVMGCDVGFVQGRNSLIDADKANHNGDHECMIWEVFARRGLGFFAEAGTTDRNDGVEDYELAPVCIDELKIRKFMPELVNKNDEVEVRLEVANYTSNVLENAVVSDFIPEGFDYIDGSGSVPGTVMGDNVFFDFDVFEVDRLETITYKLNVNDSNLSQLIYKNQVETNDELDKWERQVGEGTNIWRTIGSNRFPVYSGETAWYVAEVDEDTKQTLVFNDISISGTLPVLRFFHRINTTSGRNGGFVEISTDGVIWNDAIDKFIRNGYPNPLQYTTFAIPSQSAFSGQNNDYTDSWIDLSSYIGETISVRFRFGTNTGTGNTANDETFAEDAGWFIDDLDILELGSGDSQACFGADTLEVCTPFIVTIINDDMSTSTNESFIDGVDISLYPNPASDFFTVRINSDRKMNAQLSLTSIDGRVISTQPVDVQASENYVSLQTGHLDAGFYIVHIQSGSQVLTRKVLLN